MYSVNITESFYFSDSLSTVDYTLQYQSDALFFLLFFPQPGASLEQTHIFVLAHILRRPIIVYGVKYYKSFRGETLGYTRFQGELALLLAWRLSK